MLSGVKYTSILTEHVLSILQVKVKITPLSPLDVATFASPAKPPATPVDEKTSRSGRLIKPKKFVDESPQSSPPQAPAVTLIPAASPPPSVAPVITKIFSVTQKSFFVIVSLSKTEVTIIFIRLLFL